MYKDIVEFEFKNFEKYDYSNVLRIGHNIFEYDKPVRNPERPAILKSEDAELLRRNVKRFDILFIPTFEANVALITTVARKGKIFEIPVREIILSKGVERAKLIYRVRRFIDFCRSYKARFIFTTRARSLYEVRTPREIGRISMIFGLTERQGSSSMIWEVGED